MRLTRSILVAALTASGAAGALAQDVPLPKPSPAEAQATQTEAMPAAPGLPDAGPLPEARPAAPDAPLPSTAAPVPSESGTGEGTAAASTPVPTPDAAPGTDAAPAPQPAYVPPEKARTTPEPGAPTTPPTDVTPSEAVEAAAAIEDARTCEGELKARGARFEVEPTISDGDCGVLRPVAISVLSNGVKVPGKTQFLCRTALALDIWMSDGVAPAASKELGERRVTALTDISTYQCRARASESRISEHSRGSAIDIGGFELSDKSTVRSEAQAAGTAEDRFMADVRRAACGPFRTVLGPGTDSDHGTHLHLDIAARTNGATYCR